MTPALADLLANLDVPVLAWRASDGGVAFGPAERPAGGPLLGVAPALPVRRLGSESFQRTHGVGCSYMACAMAGGISSVEMVVALARAGMLGVFGAGGLSFSEVEGAVRELRARLEDRPNWAVNLLASPLEPSAELRLVELLLTLGVRTLTASAFLEITPALALFHARGLRVSAEGPIERVHRVIAKLSSPAVAALFLAPPPEPLLRELVASRRLTQEQARLAAQVPLAEDITVEGDSGGHTDRQQSLLLLGAVDSLRRGLPGARGVRIGVAGGIATPASVAAAFTAGADYVATGSINQASVEAATSEGVKQLLCKVGPGQTDMAPAADMFELGAQVQVSKQGTLFPARARRLFHLWQQYGAWESLPALVRDELETKIFRCPVEEVRRQVREWAAGRDPLLVEKASKDPRFELALLFRWYLGLSSRWARAGDADRVVDWQIWCGPAMAAFNGWVRGSFLEPLEERRVVVVARALLHGAATLLRARMLQLQGIPLPPEVLEIKPRKMPG